MTIIASNYLFGNSRKSFEISQDGATSVVGEAAQPA